MALTSHLSALLLRYKGLLQVFCAQHTDDGFQILRADAHQLILGDKRMQSVKLFSHIKAATYIFMKMFLFDEAIFFPVALSRLHGVDGPLGVGDDAAHIIRLIVRAGVVGTRRVGLARVTFN